MPRHGRREEEEEEKEEEEEEEKEEEEDVVVKEGVFPPSPSVCGRMPSNLQNGMMRKGLSCERQARER